MSTFSPTDVVGRALTIYRDHAGALIPAAIAVFAIVAVANLVFDDGLLAALAGAIGAIATIFYQGMVVRLVDDVRDGALDSSVGELFRSVAPVALPLFLLAIVVGISVAIGLVLLIIPGLFLLTIWAVSAPAVVLEGKGVFAALGRSRELVRGNGWNVFGVIVIVWALMIGVGIVGAAIGALGGDVLRVLVQWAVNVLVAPVAALATAVLFFTLRDGR
ncbi:hypothetical protein [Conexibacter arvalis]|uniref:Glycerophosphoryl diester phosphodiesterase membrane domain-containing protein n=1 Tax=Conexibacter arvalis TaxID=912552 RepID=A0A840IEV0_9ACTN|nr:hypothetical protein [Conexibacter arvalis]MBB4663537.1 hypothetical protein [Conexibacter arvalis]